MTPDTPLKKDTGMDPLIEEVKRRAGELKAAREKATRGHWYCAEHDGEDIIEHQPGIYSTIARTDAEFITHAANESIPLADLALRLARVVECLDGSLGNTLDCLEQNEDPDTVAIEIVQKAREQARKIACGEE